MSLILSTELISATKSNSLNIYRECGEDLGKNRELDINTSMLDEEGIADIIKAGHLVGDMKTARAAEAILMARSGKFGKPVPNFMAFQGVLEAYLKSDLIDGWIYKTEADGKHYPQLVTGISYESPGYGREKKNHVVRIITSSYGFSDNNRRKSAVGIFRAVHSFSPHEVANRRIADILSGEGIYKETPALKAAYIASLERHRSLVMEGFGKQFRINGAAYWYEEDNYSRRGLKLCNRRAIHDLESSDYGALIRHEESELFDVNGNSSGVGEVPEHPIVRIFDVNTYEFLWVHGDNLTVYEYDKSLRDKLVLPASHRDLLDVLTTDLGAFVNDFIEGKSSGNIILCKGIPGVGKTLTAEVYAELIERPLYAIHSGSLGTTVEHIEKNLRMIFQRAKRWNCVLLLDEADVFVVQREKNIEQNAIVAEFLRTLEYFDGLLFMTTNRPDDIDEAIISRCAAIINYSTPGPEDASAIWRVMAEQYQSNISNALISDLVRIFPEISPRDIKMLFRLALRVSASSKEPLSIETFRRCAMFRAIKIKESGGDQHGPDVP